MEKTRGQETRPLPDKSALSGIRKAIRAELTSAGVDQALAFDCLVAVTEACSNALLHGRDEDLSTPLPRVAWEIDSDLARFHVQDYSGEPWSRVTHPSKRRRAETLEEAVERVGGFSLELMNALMDDVSIDVSPDGTVVTLVKRFL